MRTTFFSTFAFAAMAVLLGSIAMNANTIDTFNLTQGGWTDGTPGQFIGVMLTGTFTGMLEPSGLIEAADLTNFSVQLNTPNGHTGDFTTIQPLSTGGQPFFSYNVNGGASSLDFVATGSGGYLCEGAVTTHGQAGGFRDCVGRRTRTGARARGALRRRSSVRNSSPPIPEWNSGTSSSGVGILPMSGFLQLGNTATPALGSRWRR